MKNILILCNVDPNTSPRPNRMAGWLKDDYRVTILGRQELLLDGLAASYAINPTGIFGTLGLEKNIARSLPALISRLWLFLKRDYEGLVWASLNKPEELRRQLAAQHFDLIISHDCTMLPLAFSIKGSENTKVFMDAREYYPRNFDDQLFWRLFIKPIYEYLCERYLPKCDKMVTVCEGIAEEYKRVYNVDAEVFMSLPSPHDALPAPIEPGKIKLIHHGNATESRRLELMIDTMDFVDERFRLDLMLVGKGAYMEKICSLASTRENVRVIPPVPMKEIVPTINCYDMGIYLMPPSNFNQEHALPNKLFEYIQARLGVAISPSVEMKRIVEKYDCGVVASDFSPRALAAELNALTPEKIAYFKQQSHKAAAELNAETSRKRIHEIAQNLTGRN